MRVITFTAKASKDGKLRLELPDAIADTEYEVAVVLAAKPTETSLNPTPEQLGWPKGYFEAIGNRDDTFMRHPQGSLEPLELS